MNQDVNVMAAEIIERKVEKEFSTISETFYMLTMPCFILLFLEMLINVLMVHNNLDSLKTTLRFPLEFVLEHGILILPVLLASTVYSNSVVSIFTTVVLLCFTFLLWNVLDNKNKASINDLIILPVANQQVYITYFRSIVLIFSGMVILAVDFNFFPHRFTKTETVGYSVMDAGVGLFIVSNAIVSRFPNHEENIVKVAKNIFPLLILGIGRYVSVIICDYHVNVKEYGTHWNFFITLAVVKLASFIIFKLSNFKVLNVFFISSSLLLIHQYLLNYGVRDWVFSEIEREDFIVANREGIVSALGYEILYLFGILLKQYFPLKDQAYSIIDMLSTLFPMSIVFMMLHLYFDGVDPISRRVINASYIFWILILASAMLLICLVIEIFNKIIFNKELKEKFRISLLLEAVNHNSLFYFLICNLFTGFINMSMDTSKVNVLNSFVLVFSYVCFVNLIICILFVNNIKLRL
ncbi:unnamed protein product [Bemisia tabaci]|uniref:Phosphatidylinositol-glycan biosynthesis class W protein n=1 Tax=Bemisia tabaci TaxID=7038 RepID=A0A9P0AAY8_BEMTA|nr:unnamed protein product [Bemisia tabaci]